MRARIAGEFSPMPAVKTKPSMPCRAAASMPAFRPHAVDEIVDREAARGIVAGQQARACRC